MASDVPLCPRQKRPGAFFTPEPVLCQALGFPLSAGRVDPRSMISPSLWAWRSPMHRPACRWQLNFCRRDQYGGVQAMIHTADAVTALRQRCRTAEHHLGPMEPHPPVRAQLRHGFGPTRLPARPLRCLAFRQDVDHSIGGRRRAIRNTGAFAVTTRGGMTKPLPGLTRLGTDRRFHEQWQCSAAGRLLCRSAGRYSK
jgi:hypothetical protein